MHRRSERLESKVQCFQNAFNIDKILNVNVLNVLGVATTVLVPLPESEKPSEKGSTPVSIAPCPISIAPSPLVSSVTSATNSTSRIYERVKIKNTDNKSNWISTHLANEDNISLTSRPQHIANVYREGTSTGVTDAIQPKQYKMVVQSPDALNTVQSQQLKKVICPAGTRPGTFTIRMPNPPSSGIIHSGLTTTNQQRQVIQQPRKVVLVNDGSKEFYRFVDSPVTTATTSTNASQVAMVTAAQVSMGTAPHMMTVSSSRHSLGSFPGYPRFILVPTTKSSQANVPPNTVVMATPTISQITTKVTPKNPKIRLKFPDGSIQEVDSTALRNTTLPCPTSGKVAVHDKSLVLVRGFDGSLKYVRKSDIVSSTVPANVSTLSGKANETQHIADEMSTTEEGPSLQIGSVFSLQSPSKTGSAGASPSSRTSKRGAYQDIEDVINISDSPGRADKAGVIDISDEGSDHDSDVVCEGVDYEPGDTKTKEISDKTNVIDLDLDDSAILTDTSNVIDVDQGDDSIQGDNLIEDDNDENDNVVDQDDNENLIEDDNDDHDDVGEGTGNENVIEEPADLEEGEVVGTDQGFEVEMNPEWGTEPDSEGSGDEDNVQNSDCIDKADQDGIDENSNPSTADSVGDVNPPTAESPLTSSTQVISTEPSRVINIGETDEPIEQKDTRKRVSKTQDKVLDLDKQTVDLESPVGVLENETNDLDSGDKGDKVEQVIEQDPGQRTEEGSSDVINLDSSQEIEQVGDPDTQGRSPEGSHSPVVNQDTNQDMNQDINQDMIQDINQEAESTDGDNEMNLDSRFESAWPTSEGSPPVEERSSHAGVQVDSHEGGTSSLASLESSKESECDISDTRRVLDKEPIEENSKQDEQINESALPPLDQDPLSAQNTCSSVQKDEDPCSLTHQDRDPLSSHNTSSSPKEVEPSILDPSSNSPEDLGSLKSVCDPSVGETSQDPKSQDPSCDPTLEGSSGDPSMTLLAEMHHQVAAEWIDSMTTEATSTDTLTTAVITTSVMTTHTSQGKSEETSVFNSDEARMSQSILSSAVTSSSYGNAQVFKFKSCYYTGMSSLLQHNNY